MLCTVDTCMYMCVYHLMVFRSYKMHTQWQFSKSKKGNITPYKLSIKLLYRYEILHLVLCKPSEFLELPIKCMRS